MTLWAGPFLPFFTLIWPLLLGLLPVLPTVRPYALRLLPLAPLPALWLAWSGSAGPSEAPDLFLGVLLTLDPASRMLLGMAAALWFAAGVFAQSMVGARNLALFAGFWCLTLTGNLGVFLAGDVITFYVAFAAVSLAAWFLVVHSRTDEALRAGQIYIWMAVVGEVCLLAGFLIGVHAADSLVIADIRVALAGAPLGALAVGLLVAGFGIKAGMVPLHVWLPLAHPAAPVAASAVLSGAIVKAGLAGFWLFLPPGAFGLGLIVLGLAGAFGAALWGLTQANPKAVLAYSTISQMGVMVALVGAGSQPEAVAFYALHHGLAKGALFLSVGAVMASGGRARLLFLFAAGAAAASVAGFPLTGGAAVKAAGKYGQPEVLALALTATGVTTTAIMGWFLLRLSRTETAIQHGRAFRALPVLVLVLGAVVLPWWIWPSGLDASPDYAVSWQALLDSAWPLALAGMLAVTAVLLRLRPEMRAPGDLLVLLRLLKPIDWARLNLQTRPIAAGLFTTTAVLANLTESVERALTRWRWSGLWMVAGVLVLAALIW